MICKHFPLFLASALVCQTLFLSQVQGYAHQSNEGAADTLRRLFHDPDDGITLFNRQLHDKLGLFAKRYSHHYHNIVRAVSEENIFCGACTLSLKPITWALEHPVT